MAVVDVEELRDGEMTHDSLSIDTDAGAALAGVLANGNDLERCLAAQGLGRLLLGKHSQALLAALRDADEDVRIDAAGAIAELGLKAAGPMLIENVYQDPVPDAKLAYVKALGRLTQPEASEVLRKLVCGPCEDEIIWDEEEMSVDGGDDWLEVQLAAIEALGRIGDAAAIEELNAAMSDEFGQELQRPALSAMVHMGDDGIAAIVAHLRSDEPCMRRVAASVLRQHAGPVLSGLADQLITDQDADVRLAGLAALADSDERWLVLTRDEDVGVRAAAAARLVKMLPNKFSMFADDPSPDVRQQALNAYMRKPDKPVARNTLLVLSSWIKNAPPTLAAAATLALAKLAPEHAVEPVRRLALRRGAHGEARRAAIQAIGQLSPPDVFDMLTQIARDPLQSIRLEAVGAIAEIAKRNTPEAANARQILIDAIAGQLVAPPTESTEDSIDEDESVATDEADRHGAHAAAEDNSSQTNRIRIDSEGNIVRDVNAEKVATTAIEPDVSFDENDQQEQADVVSTLDALQDGLSTSLDETGEMLLTADDLAFLELTRGATGKQKLTPDKGAPAHVDVRILAARTAAALPFPEIVDQLVAVINDRSDELRRAAATSLCELLNNPGLLDDETAGHLAPALADRDPFIRLWLLRAAANEPAGRFGDNVRELLTDQVAHVRAEAVGAMGRIDPTFDPIEYLDDTDPIVRCQAADIVLQRLGSDAAPVLLDWAFRNGGEDRFAAARSLRSLTSSGADVSSELISAMSQSRTSISRRIAIDVLTEINALTVAHSPTTAV